MGARSVNAVDSLGRRVWAFGRGDQASGLSLATATVAALIWASVAPGSYSHTWRLVPFGALGLRFSLRDWADQGLMTLFFTVVGLEIRREISVGELASWRRAAVPVIAALGGMAVPAAIYAAIIHGSTGSRGWGIPMATDVAFALGALALLGAGSSPRLRVFLMTLAVADDIATIVVLVGFYSHQLLVAPLVLGLACLATMAGLEALKPTWITVQVALGVVSWWGLARGGVEAAVIGVAIGALALPSPVRGAWARLRGPRGWELRIQPWLVFAVLPVFALANAGVSLRSLGFSAPGTLTIFLGVLVARVVGKPLGITLTYELLRRTGPGRHRPGLPVHAVLGVGSLASVGFTVPLLIVQAALSAGPLADSATLGLLVGSLIGAVGGFVILKMRTPDTGPTPLVADDPAPYREL